jgi:ferredoxin
VKIKLDRTLCDGFGLCAKHAPDYFSLDDWGYASLVGNGEVPERDQAAVTRAMLDCPVHAILKIGEYRPPDEPTSADQTAVEEPDVDAEDSDAEWFVR